MVNYSIVGIVVVLICPVKLVLQIENTVKSTIFAKCAPNRRTRGALFVVFCMSGIKYGEIHIVSLFVVLVLISIILNVAGRVMGIVVDGVSDVLTLEAEQMRPTPEFGSVIDTEYIMGLGTVEERMLILIDIEKLMGSSEMGLIDQTIN